MTKLGLKITTVAVITVGLLVPLALIRGLIHERTRYRTQAREDIARSWTGAQDVIGPMLVVPPLTPDWAKNEPVKLLFALPETLDVRASVRSQTRKRGLYALPVYSTRLTITGEFDLSRALPSGEVAWTELDLEAAALTLGVSDNRGIVAQPELLWDGERREFAAGSWIPSGQGVHARVGSLTPAQRTRYPFRIEVELRGMESLQFSPAGRDTRVVLDADWPHPSFVGRFLPVEHEIDLDGFRAEWRVSGLAGGGQRAWFGSAEQGSTALANTFGVSLIDPVDIYQQATRSVKYGNLIVLLSFTAVFLVELVRRLMLHPMQYLLVGLALVVFFLLLLALSEHMPFGIAYLTASIACVGLVGIYISAALGSRANAIAVTGTLAGLHTMLFAILKSEDNALLMGSLLLFVALAAVMLVTRRVDWYRLGQAAGRASAAGSGSNPGVVP